MDSPREISMDSTFLEQKYNELSDHLKKNYSKVQLLDRLSKINWNKPQEGHGSLCLRSVICSPDCVGSDC